MNLSELSKKPITLKQGLKYTFLLIGLAFILSWIFVSLKLDELINRLLYSFLSSLLKIQ